MSDRNNLIKFGPEWLRNLARERSAGRTINENPRPGANQSTRSTGSQGPGGLASQGSTGATGSSNTTGQTLTPNASRPGNTTQGTGVTSPCDSGASGGSIVPSTSSGITTRNSSTNQTPKILLAKQRYGREEMLALYDTNVEAPDELKYFDILYQPRGKPPAALNSFEEETSENIRGSAPIGATSPGERFGAGRGRGVTDTRARPRLPFLRVPPSPVPGGRGFSTMGSPRMAGFSGGDEEHGSARSWSASNGGAGQNRTSAERSDQTDWNKMFRRRQPNNTNWRQQTSREDDEWRHSSGSENPRNNRPNTDKWDRDWNERQGQDRPQGWNSNRRTWVANETQNNEDNLPEWAVDNAEAGAGTFDSSGAFHGFSNDDSNIPRTQESTYPLARSHTHGSFVRSKTVEEGSEEWWASEKAKKLSPKRFEAGDMKYKRSHSTGSAEQSPASNTNQNTNLNFVDLQDIPEKLESHPPNPEPSLSNIEDKKKKFSESKTFDAHMRSDINFSENSNEQSNFQSVIITPNNSLRQKHQNIVSPTGSETTNTGSSHGLQGMHASHKKEENSSTVSSDQILDGIIDLSMDDTNVRSSMLLEENTVPSSQGIITSLPNQSPSLMRITNPSLPTHGMSMNSNNLPSVLQGQGIQNVGLQNVAMNSSLGLPIGATNNGMVMQMQGLPPVIQNSQINSPIASGLHNLPVIGGFPPNNPLPVMQPQVNSLFLNQSNNPQISSASDIQMPNHVSQNNIFPMHGHGLQHSSSQVPFGSIYSNVMSSGQQPSNNLTDQWYYEDPKKVIQGPFSSKDMYEWFRAGFFNSSLMVRRACDTHMRPLGSYGPVVPFVQDVISPFPMSGFDSIPQSTHEVMNQQPALGIEDSLWSQPRQSQDLLWMQQAMNTRNETGVNNLPIFFWDPQPSSAISSNSLLPEDIAKEMKTEDQILAQLRASQNIPVSTTPFLNDNTTTTITNTPPSVSQKDESFTSVSGIKAPGLEELQKLMHNETLKSNAAPDLKDVESSEVKNEKVTKAEPLQTGTNIKLAQNKISSEKSTKQVKSESDKAVKNKDNNTTKAKNKKAKEKGKAKEEIESKSKEEDSLKTEKRSAETSPTKSRKDEKPNKKEIEKEKKEWIKEGFTIVKGPEKSVYKESKKKADEVKAIEEAERKRKEEEKAAVEEEKKKRVAESKKPQEQQKQNLTESLMKKAPWSAVATQAVTTNKDGLTLAEIQRLEREKKLEQIKEQQHMMQIIAQQQAVALAREQEMQAGLGWAKKKSANNTTGQSLAEIQKPAVRVEACQDIPMEEIVWSTRSMKNGKAAGIDKAEAKRQSAAAAAAAAAAQAIEDAQAMAVTQQPQTNHVPWGSSQNGGGFWETQSSPSPMPEKPQESVKTEPSKSKKKMNINVTAKKETLPTVEFESWCTTVLASWSSKIDVPTFIGFLRDIESPYEVKDYVKCYLGESKDSNDFARQFLERRSKLLRVGMVTPSDDLCSPAMAINPRSTSVSDSQEGKSKKTKKNKMLKVDARILGFSVTASEDRINVGDIDTV